MCPGKISEEHRDKFRFDKFVVVAPCDDAKGGAASSGPAMLSDFFFSRFDDEVLLQVSAAGCFASVSFRSHFGHVRSGPVRFGSVRSVWFGSSCFGLFSFLFFVRVLPSRLLCTFAHCVCVVIPPIPEASRHLSERERWGHKRTKGKPGFFCFFSTFILRCLLQFCRQKGLAAAFPRFRSSSTEILFTPII